MQSSSLQDKHTHSGGAGGDHLSGVLVYIHVSDKAERTQREIQCSQQHYKKRIQRSISSLLL